MNGNYPEYVNLFVNEDFKNDFNQYYKERLYFPGKKGELKFVCVIQQLPEHNELEIAGMKIYSNTNSRTANEIDASTIEKTQMIKLLPFPK